jgi:FkbM family methyltransferase
MNNISKKLKLRKLLNSFQKSTGKEYAPIAIFNSDAIGKHIITDGFYEAPTLECIKFSVLEKLKYRRTCLDIGANIGNHSLFFSYLFDDIISFEPNPRAFLLLQANAMLNKNIKPVNLGLSSTPGKSLASIGLHNIGGASLNIKRDNSIDVEFELNTLDNFVFQNSIKNIDFIKIDVEGHEIEVLKGAQTVLDQYKPCIAIEILKSDIKNGKSKILDLLKENGYKYFYTPQETNPLWMKSHGVAKFLNSISAYFFNITFLEKYRLINLDAENIKSHDYSMVIATPEILDHKKL